MSDDEMSRGTSNAASAAITDSHGCDTDGDDVEP